MDADLPEDCTILLVDDDPDANIILARLLSFMGWKIAMANNGRAALEIAAQHTPTLILLDLMMPVMSGFEVIARLKQDPVLKDVPVVIISALGANRRLKELGAAAVMPKGTFTQDTLTAVLNKVLGTAKPRTPQSAEQMVGGAAAAA